MKRLVQESKAPVDWTPLGEFVDVKKFRRVGTFLEVQDWGRYTEMLTHWASAVERFETTVLRISELPPLVYFEIEERHYRADTPDVVNSLTVFEFSEGGKIRGLNVYLQSSR